MAYATLVLLGWFFKSKTMPSNDTNYIQLPYKSCRTCITNHMGPHHAISLLLVINSLGADTTQIQTHMHMHNDVTDKTNLRDQVHTV